MLGHLSTTNFAITLASLASGSARESTAITAFVGGTTYDDVMLELRLGIGTPTSAADKLINVWFYGSADGTNYTTPATGSNAAITIGTNHNLKGPFTVAVNVGTLYQYVEVPSVAIYFGGNIPKKWGIIVENQANGSISGTEYNQWFTPIIYTT